MAKESTSSSTIWRTVVFAGAMLGTPTLVAAEQAPMPPAKAPTAPAAPAKGGASATPAAAPVAAKPAPDPASEKQGKIKSLDAERTALLAKIGETDPKELDALKKQIVAKDLQIKKLVDELVTMRKPRPRTPLVQKPVGRGFVLA